MLIPLSWLKRYVPVEMPAQELAHRLTMAGLEIDEVREVGADWGRDKVFVGHVTAVDRHPNADRLTVPTVDLGDETVQVVCGGPNLAAGQKIAFAFAGAMLYSTRTGKTQALKKSKIRGVESAGMVCSEVELGLGDDHEGIMVLPEDAPVGTPLVDYLGDAVLDADVTPNRPDCLSILGVAHEVAALTGATVTEPDATYPEDGDPIERDVTVEIADPELCSRYGASLIRGVKVGPSPDWLKDALSGVGMRPINNIVDVTNYVMLEYGQPLHAFDYDTIGDATVIIRAAHPGEKFTTLDEEERKLEPPMLTIADSQDAIALAGVMGGQNTEVGDSTTNVLIESANFDANNTRNTATGLGMRTEASYRFERGIRQDLVPRALRRATALMLELAGGEAAKGIVDVFPVVKTPPTLTIGPEHFRRVLGAEINTDTIDRVLTSLGFETTRDGDSLEVQSPYWRADITIAEDLIEEVARIVGYDDVPATLMSTEIPHHEPRIEREIREQVRDALVAAGMQETISYSATSAEALQKVEVPTQEPDAPLRLANPMSAELSHMRTTLRSGVLQTLAFNRRMSRGEGLRLFEIGPVYLPKEEVKERDLPDEREMLVGVLSGPRSGASWLVPEGDMDFFDAKGVLEAIFSHVGLSEEYKADDDPILLSGKTASVFCGNKAVGTIGEVHPKVLARFDLDDTGVTLFEIDLEAVYAAAGRVSVQYAPISRYPEAEQDIALLVDADVPASRIQTIINRHRLVKKSAPFDLYAGEGVPAGKRSIAFRVTFQSDRSTLTGDLVDKARGDIMRQLEREFDATLRG
ncbi:MAG: phenylalanine--tRNA ligase subunit beta [Dehalococcoidia bacterium]|nr:phenylalanine--tRNA ligase subunit beta [Dehalococcoidia bacterium]